MALGSGLNLKLNGFVAAGDGSIGNAESQFGCGLSLNDILKLGTGIVIGGEARHGKRNTVAVKNFRIAFSDNGLNAPALE